MTRLRHPTSSPPFSGETWVAERALWVGKESMPLGDAQRAGQDRSGRLRLEISDEPVCYRVRRTFVEFIHDLLEGEISGNAHWERLEWYQSGLT